MKEKIENNNEKNKGVEEFVEKGESVGKVLGGYLEPSEEEPETQEENLKKILSEYSTDEVSDEEKKALMDTTKSVEAFMKKLTVVDAPLVKSAEVKKKGLQNAIKVEKMEERQKNTGENSKKGKEKDTEKIQEI